MTPLFGKIVPVVTAIASFVLMSSHVYAGNELTLGYSKEQLEGNHELRDRVAIQLIQQALYDRFVGNQVFPNDGNTATKDYINFILKPFQQFYLNGALPETMRMLPVAGPSGVAKTLIIREAAGLLTEYGLLSPDRYFFRQGDENAEIDLSVLDMFKVPEATVEEFKAARNFEKKKDVFLKVMAFIVFDEASHMPILESNNLEEAIALAVSKYRKDHPRSSEPQTLAVERPKEPIWDDFKNNPDANKNYEAAWTIYERDFAKYVLRGSISRPSPTMTAISRDEEVRKVVHRVISQFFSQRRLSVIEAEIWQALAGGKITGTTKEDVEGQLKREMDDVLHRIATMQAEFRKLRHANPNDPVHIFTQLDEIQSLKERLEIEALKIAELQKQDAALRQAGLMFTKLTVSEAQKWAARSGHYEANFEAEKFSSLSEGKKLEIWNALAKDFNEHPDDFKLQTASLAALSAVFVKNSDNQLMHEALKYNEPNALMSSIGKVISTIRSGHQAKVTELQAKIDLITKRHDEFQEDRKNLEAQRGLIIENVVADYVALKEQYEKLIYEAVRSSEPVGSKIKARLEKLNAGYLEKEYSDYFNDLVQIDQLDPAQFLKDLVASRDPNLMFRELVRMDKEKAFKLVVDTINEGNLGTSVNYLLASTLFLQNVLPVEKAVNAMAGESRNNGKIITYDLYADFYAKALKSSGNTDDWATTFYKAHFPHLVNGHNIIATRRRLGGEIGPLFITPPNSLQVANLVAQVISTVFVTWHKHLPEHLAKIAISLHLDRNVAMALVPKNVDASLGVAQTLSRVESELYAILSKIEGRLLEVSKNPASQKGDVVNLLLTLEKVDPDEDHAVIAARFAPPSVKIKNVFKQTELNGVEFPEGSLIGSIPIQINDSVFIKSRDVFHGDQIMTVPGISLVNTNSIAENADVNLTKGMQDHARNAKESEAKAKHQKLMTEATVAWTNFFWPKRGFWGYFGWRTNLSPSKNLKKLNPEPWFVNWYRHEETRRLIDEGTINHANFQQYRDDENAHPREAKIAKSCEAALAGASTEPAAE